MVVRLSLSEGAGKIFLVQGLDTMGPPEHGQDVEKRRPAGRKRQPAAAPAGNAAAGTAGTAAPPRLAEEAAAASWVPIGRLRPWPGNPRQNAAAVEEVARSIRRFGFASPIIARAADGEIIAGHTRYMAAKRLKLDRVPVRFMDLDPADAHMLALADNRVGELAEWSDGLGDVLRQLQAEDRDITTLGWSEAELQRLVEPESEAESWDQSDELDDALYQVLIECTDEQHQGEILRLLEREGIACRALIA